MSPWTGPASALPSDVKVCIVADRGNGRHKLCRLLTEELKFDYVIRFRGNTIVTAADWVAPDGRTPVLRDAMVTEDRYRVVCVQEKATKQPWQIATSSTTATARALMTLYAKRWSIECGLRDTKNLRFGMGMGSIRVSTPKRRDRRWLLSALAIVLLTLLGAAGEALGYDRLLKSNTSKHRQHSLFAQGCLLYDLIPNMPQHRVLPLLERFDLMIKEIPMLKAAFNIV